MKTVSLLGKQYSDTILFIDSLVSGETNRCCRVIERLGGMYNFLEASTEDVIFKFSPLGHTRAWIISNFANSERTSFVESLEVSIISEHLINSVNATSDWAHICYVDDIEECEDLEDFKIPYSLDFCTLKDRSEFVSKMKGASVIFDSRERSFLYQGISIDTPIVLHDSRGIEIIVNGNSIYEEDMTPTMNLNVNGAGDIFAANFIKNYFQLNLKESSYRAMLDTTNTLIKRSNEEV